KAVKKKKPREKEKEQELVPEEPAEEKRKPVVEKKGRRREEKKEPEETAPQTVQRPNGNSTTTVPAPRTASRLPVPITDGSKIMLPTSDTPIQRKNQALRKGAGADRRRSSLGLRGRRASTMMEDGIMCMRPNSDCGTRGHGEPHSEIFHADFYKHIDESQMENTRMKQLLTWCGKRELDSGVLKEADPNASNSGTEEGARKIARMLAEDLLKEVSTNGQLSTWFTRDASPAPETIKKPNPRNESNKADQERLKAQLATLNKEHASWMSLMNLKPNFTVPTPSTNDSTLLRPSEAAARASLASRQDILSNARKLCKLQSSEIELNIDRLEYGVHKLKSFQGMADSLAGITLQTAGDVLEAREKGIKLAAETQEIETMDVLRAISWAQAEGVDTA
ncbi:Mis12-Mtw1 protein family-domain-containing protein, partial [Pyronema omphalodes]